MSDLKRRAKLVVEHISTAFGGVSQVAAEDLGRAIAGQVNNNGLCCHGTLEEVCQAVADEFDGDGEYPVDRAAVLRAAQQSLDSLEFDWKRLPFPARS